MSRWSNHPMGSNHALNVENAFFEKLNKKLNKKKRKVYRTYLDLDDKKIKKYLLSLSLSDLQQISSQENVVSDKYVIPYIFIKYNAFPKKNKIKKYLYYCLESHASLGKVDNLNLIDDESLEAHYPELLHIKKFKNNFDNYITGKEELEQDEGLFFTLFG